MLNLEFCSYFLFVFGGAIIKLSKLSLVHCVLQPVGHCHTWLLLTCFLTELSLHVHLCWVAGSGLPVSECLWPKEADAHETPSSSDQSTTPSGWPLTLPSHALGALSQNQKDNCGVSTATFLTCWDQQKKSLLELYYWVHFYTLLKSPNTPQSSTL